MKPSIWFYTALISTTAILPLAAKVVNLNQVHSAQQVTYEYYQNCDFSNDPSGCQSS